MHSVIIVIGEDWEDQISERSFNDDYSKGNWDWHTVGGRWAGNFVDKKGNKVSSLKRGNLDIEKSKLIGSLLVGGYLISEDSWEATDNFDVMIKTFIQNLEEDVLITLVDVHS